MGERGLIEDLFINLIRDMVRWTVQYSTVQHSTVQYNNVQVIGQINAILGITTTTTPCTGLVGGGLLCPPALPIPGK